MTFVDASPSLGVVRREHDTLGDLDLDFDLDPNWTRRHPLRVRPAFLPRGLPSRRGMVGGKKQLVKDA